MCNADIDQKKIKIIVVQILRHMTDLFFNYHEGVTMVSMIITSSPIPQYMVRIETLATSYLKKRVGVLWM